MNRKAPALIILFIPNLFSPLIAAATGIEEQLVIENAWIAEAPPVSRVMVAYMTLNNRFHPCLLHVSIQLEDKHY